MDGRGVIVPVAAADRAAADGAGRGDFFGNRGMVAYGQLAAFSIVYSTPVVLLYVLISRRLGGGFALGGAVKG